MAGMYEDENIEMLINTWWEDKNTPKQRFHVSSVATGVLEPTLIGSMHLDGDIAITPVSMPVCNLKHFYLPMGVQYQH